MSSKTTVDHQIDEINNWPNWLFAGEKNDVKLIQKGADFYELDNGDNDKLLSLKVLYPKKDSSVFQMQSPKGNPIILDFRTDSLNVNLTRLNLIATTSFKWYPWDRARSIFYDRVMGGNFQQMVENIKKVCEAVK